MNIVEPLVEAYAASFSDPESDLLKEVHHQTIEEHPRGHMISGHLQGQFLQFICNILKPSRVLEIGTFTGYSALCMVQGLAEGGEIHTIEMREEDADRARENFSRSNQGDRIILHIGNALEIIPTLDQTWDLVFIDADKVSYELYYNMILPNVRPGGVILADNVLFHGQVLENPVKGKNAKAMHAFNQMVCADQRVEKMILTMRDGLMLIRKK
ncbi:MAG: O-methyltransferase [Flavitalea sp.]